MESLTSIRGRPTQSRWVAVAATGLGVAVLALGWGVMGILWMLTDEPRPERGFTFFASGFLGDLLFLPTLSGGLLAYVLIRKSCAKEETAASSRRRRGIVSAVAGFTVGAAIQAEWLISADTELNWTIPTPHTFNFAGWWHAGFFTGMFSLVTYLTVSFIASRHKTPSAPASQQERIALFFIWFGATGYTLVRVYEVNQLGFDDWRMLAIAGISSLTAWLVTWVPTLHRPEADTLRVCLSAGLAAYGVATAGALALKGDLVAWPVLLAASFSILAPRMVPLNLCDLARTTTTELLTAAAAFGLITAIIAAKTPELALTMVLLAIPTLYFVADTWRLRSAAETAYLHETGRDRLFPPALLLTVAALGLLSQEAFVSRFSMVMDQMNLTSVRKSVFALALLICTLVITNLFDAFARAPESLGMSLNEIASGKDAAYRRITVTFAGFVLLAIFFAGQNALDLSQSSTWGLFVLVPLVGCLVALTRSRPRTPLSVLLLATSFGLLALTVWGLREPVHYSNLDWLLVFPVLGSSLFIVNGMVRNGWLLIGRSVAEGRRDKYFILSFGITLVGCLLVFPACIFPSKGSDGVSLSVVSPLIGLLGLYLASCILPPLGARAFGCPEEGPPLIADAGARGVRQDAQNAFYMIVMAGLVAILLWEWLSTLSNWAAAVFLVLVVVSGATVIVQYTLKNNSTHFRNLVEDMDQAIAEGADTGEVSALRLTLLEHLERQAQLVLWALMPYSLLFLLVPLVLRPTHSDSGTPHPRYAVAVYNTYLLRLPGLEKDCTSVSNPLTATGRRTGVTFLERVIWY